MSQGGSDLHSHDISAHTHGHDIGAHTHDTSLADNTPRDLAPSDPGAILRLAVERGLDAESLERLAALHERMEARQAAKDFLAAMSAFRAACPEIPRHGSASYRTAKGARREWRYALMDDIQRLIRQPLYEHQLDYSWDTAIIEGNVQTTAIVWHVNGHSKESTFICPPNSNLGGLSEPFGIAWAVQYGKRLTLGNVLGLSFGDPPADDTGEAEKISQSDYDVLVKRVRETGADVARFLSYMGVENLQDITVDQLGAAHAALDAKERQKGSAQ